MDPRAEKKLFNNTVYGKSLIFIHLMESKNIIFTSSKIKSYSKKYLGKEIAYGNNYNTPLKSLQEIQLIDFINEHDVKVGRKLIQYTINYYNLAHFMFNYMKNNIKINSKILNSINQTSSSLTSENEYLTYLERKLHEFFDIMVNHYQSQENFVEEEINNLIHFDNINLNSLIKGFAQYLEIEKNEHKGIYTNIYPVVYFYLVQNNLLFSFQQIINNDFWEELEKKAKVKEKIIN